MHLLDRYLRIRIVAAEPETVLTKMMAANAELLDVQWLDILTVEIKIRKMHYPGVRDVLDRGGISYRIIKREGMLWSLPGLVKRPVLVCGILLFLFLACFLPGRIFLIEITGNESVSDNEILQQMENYGIGFGAKAADIRSENVKNFLLGKLPTLQWVGVTTSGCRATVNVKERSTPAEQNRMENAVSSIVAAQDGVITQMNIYRGNPLVQVGQTVKSGDILVSGYTDCGLFSAAQQADAEVFAHTLRNITAISPVSASIRGPILREYTCYSLRVGKKVINLCNHSGILDATCVKMYSEDYWTLPGGVRLPISVIKVKTAFYVMDEEAQADEDGQWMAQYAKTYVMSQMVAGKVLNESLIWNVSEGCFTLSGHYACHEMIGQVKYEETVEQYAKDN